MSEFNREVEIKFKVDESILSNLKNLTLVPHEEVDEYFTTKQMLENYTFLRIRKRNGKIILELKDVVKETEDCYESDELEIELTEDQYEKIKKMLLATFPHNFIVKKIRSKGEFNGCEICLDDVENLGLFFEIEGDREKILETCKMLNLDMGMKDTEKGYAIMTAKREGLI